MSRLSKLPAAKKLEVFKHLYRSLKYQLLLNKDQVLPHAEYYV